MILTLYLKDSRQTNFNVEHFKVYHKGDIENSIKKYCEKHNIETCYFTAEGRADIKVIVETEGLGALFG